LLLACSLLRLCLLTFQYFLLCFWNQVFLDFNGFVHLLLLLLHALLAIHTLCWFGLRVSENLVFASFDSHCQDFQVAGAGWIWSLQLVRHEAETYWRKWSTHHVDALLLLWSHDCGMGLLNLGWIGCLSFLCHACIESLGVLLRRHLLSHVSLGNILAWVIFVLGRSFSNSKVLAHTRLKNRDWLTLLESGLELDLSRNALKVFLLRFGCLYYRKVELRMSVYEFLWCLNFLFHERLVAADHFSKYILIRIDHSLLTIVNAHETRPALGLVVLHMWRPLHLLQWRANPISLLRFISFVIAYWFCHFSF